MELLDLIDRLEEVVETGARVPWTGKSLVDAETVAEIVDRMRAAVPAEVQEAQGIRGRGEAIVSEAVLAARKIRAKADLDYKAAVEESTVLKEAQAHAAEIVAQAEREAQHLRQRAEAEASTRRQESDAYVEESLARLLEHVRAIKEQATGLEGGIAEVEQAIHNGVKYLRAKWERTPVPAGVPAGAHPRPAAHPVAAGHQKDKA